MADEEKTQDDGLARNERSEITVGYEFKPSVGWEVRFYIDGITKLMMPLKALRVVVETGDKKEEERQEKAKFDWLSQSINVLGTGRK